MVALRPKAGSVSLLVFAWFLLFSSPVAAGIVNRTIDDSFGDSQTSQLVTYLPSTGAWDNENCIGCAINPDVSQAFKGTYTAATYNPGLGSMSITMQFSGTAIYVFFILANNQGDGITTLTLANFSVDGKAPQLFQHAPDLTTTNIEYNQLVFSQTNLADADHTLVISTSGVNENVYVNFDYAIYTHDDALTSTPLSTAGTTTAKTSNAPAPTSSSPPSTSAGTGTITGTTTATVTATATLSGSAKVNPPSTNALTSTTPTSTLLGVGVVSSAKSHVSTGAVAGGVIGGIAVLALIIFLIFFFRRRKTQSSGQRNIEAAGQATPPMTQMDYGRDQQAAIVSPFAFAPTSPQTELSSYSQRSGYARVPLGSKSELSMPSGYHQHSASQSQSDNRSAYGGFTDPSTSGSDAGPGYIGQPSRGPLRMVTSGDHLSSPDDTVSTTPQASSDIESTRRARQNELDERLRLVQQEMTYLASDVNNGEKGARHRSVRRTLNRGATGVEGEEEMGLSEMKEQLRSMRDQIAYLQDQQRSAWAQGLSDDAPPGYSPATSS